MSSYSRVIHHATSTLCGHRGSMELAQLHRKVFQRFDITDEDFWYIVKKCPRFAVVRNRQKADNRESDYIIVAKTSLRLCKSYPKEECYGCQDLHLCKYFVYGNCRYGKGRKECRFSHNIQSEHNYPLLRECTLHELHEEDLFLLLLQNDPTLLPEVCSHYNKGSGLFGACTFREHCTKVHVCQHFVQDDCIFGAKCKRLHSIDGYSRRMLEERGLSGDIIHHLPYLYQNVHRLSTQAPDPPRGESCGRGVVGQGAGLRAYAPPASRQASCGLSLSNARGDRGRVERIPETVSRPLLHSEDKSEICLHFLRRNCRFQEQCKLVHFNLPYKWEVHEGCGWRELRGMEEIERAYCDPKNTHSPGSRPVDFVTMSRGCDPVRRLSTASSVTKPSHYILTTQWIWYYKGDHENWIEYGKPDDKQRITSVTSRDLELAFLDDCTAEVTVIKGNRHYYVSFQDMYQRNPKHNTKRRVHRRPRFVSINEVESKVAQ
ncbi:protein mono-ADP-ribosyltransferase PARP12b isoform X2 [Brachyhypopomus gauderio]|uniref:protein mono-ADP-ribosyltransferase PARP12b isoform X2 n=1 Tax=Brachyhypopomus gauderio TaxID=698409 RepID=UPI0040435545